MSTEAQEPTMDDILASIRRIIAEDNEKEVPPSSQDAGAQNVGAQNQDTAVQEQGTDQPAEAVARPPAPQVQSKPAQQPPASVQAAAPPRTAQLAAQPSAAQPTGGGQAFVMERQAEEDEDGEVLVLNNLLENAKAAARPMPKRPNSANPGARQGKQGLPGAPNGKLSRQEEERLLSATTESLGTAAFATLERAVRMGRAGETLEDVVRNLLRPMLRGWIDQNLPGLVERMVQSEIQKIVSGARRSWEDEDPDQ